MKNSIILSSAAVLAILVTSCSKQKPPQPWDDDPVRTDVLEEGYYKDIFMDGGIRLTGRTTLPSSKTLNLSLEFYACPSAETQIAKEDSLYQRWILSDSDGSVLPADENGVLLYPDGEPRFRMIYMNGGQSTAHATSLTMDGCKGIERIRTFYNNGGAYVGTCAGAFMTGTGYDSKESFVYLRFVNFKPQHTHVSEQYMSMTVEPNCPLLKYYDFGGDLFIKDIYHNGGCYANEGLCVGAEPLLRYRTVDHAIEAARNINGKISSWAFKKDIYSGRLCAIGSHPEGVDSGERLDLMCAFEKYAIDGRGIATIKDTLFNGKEVAMTKSFADNDPQHAKIGDLQNHHFAIWVPAGARNLTITLDKVGGETYEGCNLHLFAKKGNFAILKNGTDHAVVTNDAHKEISIPAPEKGLYYICVNCPTTVTSVPVTYTNSLGKNGNYFEYSGHTEVLNGVPYTIKATWTE